MKHGNKQEYELLRLRLILMGEDVIRTSGEWGDGNSSEGDPNVPDLPPDWN